MKLTVFRGGNKRLEAKPRAETFSFRVERGSRVSMRNPEQYEIRFIMVNGRLKVALGRIAKMQFGSVAATRLKAN